MCVDVNQARWENVEFGVRNTEWHARISFSFRTPHSEFRTTLES